MAQSAVEASGAIRPRSSTSQRRGLLLPEQRVDLVAVGLLVLVPVLLFGIPASAGHPILAGDALVQGYPLRVLVGHQLSGGSLPLWNPYLWSGSPLLAGWSAGAADPFTWLFALVGPTAAWALNEIIAFVVAGLGLFAFCRALRLRTVASFLAACSFAFAGVMSAQVAHIGLVEGLAWIPWMVLALKKIADPLTNPPGASLATRRGARARLHLSIPWAWVALLALSGGMVILSGEPRAVSDAVVVTVGYGSWLLSNSVKRYSFLVSVSIGIVWAFCLGALQLIPGLQFVHESQRSVTSYATFGAGSLPVPWTALLVVPDLLGGSGSFGQPAFMGSQPIADVVGYVGLLPLVASFGLVVRSWWVGPGAFSRWRAWGPWYLVGIVGLLLAYGSNTFLGTMLWHLPFYGGLSLQSRNLGVVDLALSIIFAFWIDEVLAPDPEFRVPIPEVDESMEEEELREAIRARRSAVRRARENEKRRRWLDGSTARFTTAFPALVGVLLCLVGLYLGPGFARAFGHVSATEADRHYRGLIPSLTVDLSLCLVAAAIGAYHRRLRVGARRFVLVVFTVVDILVFTGSTVAQLSGNSISVASREVTSSLSTAVGPSTPGMGGLQAQAAASTSSARFAVFDPRQANAFGLSHLGEPDLNILRGKPSVQGYGSVAPGGYVTRTGTYGRNTFSPQALYDGAFGSLDLRYLYTLPQYLSTVMRGREQLSGRSWNLDPGGVRGWYFGSTLDVSQFRLTNEPDSAQTFARFAGVQVGLVLSNGDVVWPRTWQDDQAGPAYMSTSTPTEAIGVEIHNVSGQDTAVLSQLVVTDQGGEQVALQGELAGMLEPGAWRYVGPAYGYQLFERSSAAPFAFLSTSQANWKVISGTLGDAVTVEVKTPEATRFVRSVGYLPGWKASIEALAGPGHTSMPTREVPVKRDGLVQAVSLPPGHYLLHLFYRPSSVTWGLALSLAGLAAFLLLAVVAWARAVDRRGAAGLPPLRRARRSYPR